MISCRSQEKIDETLRKLKTLGVESDVQGIVLELSSLDSVRSCAAEYLKSGRKLNYLINNAGVMACPLSHTKDGFEMQASSEWPLVVVGLV